MENKNSYQKISLFVWSMILIHSSCESASDIANMSTIRCTEPERKALLKIKRLFIGNNVGFELGSWVSDDCCQWEGVGCDEVTGNIIIFNPHAQIIPTSYFFKYAGVPSMPSFTDCSILENCINHKKPVIDIFGPMISALQGLNHLTHLELSGADFGNFPISKTIASLTHLTYLNLSNAGFSGEIPPQLGNLTDLKVLDLSRNSITVKSLNWLSILPNLKILDMSFANLSQVGNTIRVINQLPLSSLRLLFCQIEDNHLSHLFVGNSTIFSTLKYLDLSFNSFGNAFISNVGNLSSLRFLDLSANYLSGLIPPWLPNIKGLQYLDLGANEFEHAESTFWEYISNSCHLNHLDLSDNQIQGYILQHMSKFRCISSNLEYLDLSINIFTSTMPASLTLFTSLKLLDLSDNRLSGSIPDSLGKMTKLEHLDISSNTIQGEVSLLHLESLSRLSYLDMSYNNVSINLMSDWLPPFQLRVLKTASCKIRNSPQWLQTQTMIQELDLSNTGISGELHEWICDTSSVTRLNLSSNFISGPLPQQVGHQDLHTNSFINPIPGNDFITENFGGFIDLSSNQFSGSIPLTWGHNCTTSIIKLDNNKITGYIPLSIKHCSNLIILDLSKNKLLGKIPYWIGEKLRHLQILRLQENRLGEATLSIGKATIPNSLCKLKSLQVLDLQKNRLSGTIANCWENTTDVILINLSSNNLSGEIPCTLGMISNLQYLHLSDNKLSGGIPSCLGNLSQMRIFNLGGNELSGGIPTWIGTNFPVIQILRLPRNKLKGILPEKLCNISRLHVMDLSDNQLTGNIPTCLGNLVGMKLPVHTSNNTFEDTIFYPELDPENKIQETIAGIEREYSKTLNYLTTIDLSANKLVGTIPEELTQLYELVALNLANNCLTGNIPEKIGDMKALETLDLSENKLGGRIPTNLGSIDFLNYLNLSFNNLSGPIPTSRHLQTLDDPSIYMGNPYLCGDTLLKKCSSHGEQPNTSGDKGKGNLEDQRENMWFYLVVMLGFATGFWGVVGTLLQKKRWRHALFSRVEDVYDWLYLCIALKMSKLKKWMKKDNSVE